MMEFLEYMGISFVSSCVLLILSKIVMCRPLRKNKDFYENSEAAEEAKLLSGIDTIETCELKGGEKNDDE